MRLSQFARIATLSALVVSAAPDSRAEDVADVFIKTLVQRLELTEGRCPDSLRDRAGSLKCFHAKPNDVLREAHEVAFALAKGAPVLERRWTERDPRQLLELDPLAGFRRASYLFDGKRVVLWVGYDPVADDGSLPIPLLSVVFAVEAVDQPFPEVFPAR